MRTPIATLLERAAHALPPQKPSRSSWAPYYPVVQTLMVGGHNVRSAVEWLSEQKEIEQSQQAQAYRALLALHKRRNPQPTK